jgi:serine/threonine protein kinase
MDYKQVFNKYENKFKKIIHFFTNVEVTDNSNIIWINLGSTSITFKINTIFVKKIVEYSEFDVYKREKYISAILNDKSWYPSLLYFDDKDEILVFQNVGNSINVDNIPNDFNIQFNCILADLKKLNIQHNDITEEEILIDSNNRIYLCDFGWASINYNTDCGIGLWNCTNQNKPGGCQSDDNVLKRIFSIT